MWNGNSSFIRKFSWFFAEFLEIFAEFLENSIKNWAIFQGFAIFPYCIKNFWVFQIDICSHYLLFNTKQHWTIIRHYVW